VKIIRGDHSSRVNYREPLPSSETPEMPADMDAEAEAVWRRVIAAMGTSGVIRVPDSDVLRCYREAVSCYTAAVRLYVGSGPLIKYRGSPVKNPIYQIMRESREQVRLFARELGLTPSARAGLKVEPIHTFDQIEHDIGLPPRLRALAGKDG
jgi:P27 family predicted phage terminase small subunit